MLLYYNTDYCSRHTANDIANFCDRLCNYGMIIKTEPKVSRLGTNLIACNVEGKLENYVNWAEVDAVEALIEELLGVGYWFNIFFQKMKNIHIGCHFQHIAHRNAKMGFS